MHHPRPIAIASLGAALLGATLALTGCYEESGDAPPAVTQQQGDGAADAQATQPAEGDAEPVQAYGNSQSTLGKARDTAKGTIADLEARDREIQKQIDDQ